MPDGSGETANPPAVDPELVRLLYSQSNVSQLGALVIALVTASTFWHDSSHVLVAGWLLYMLAAVAIRYRLHLAFKNCKQLAADSAGKWETAYFVAVIISALGWGASGLFFFRDDSLAHQVFLIGMLAGVSAGAVPLLSASLRSTYVLLVLAITPVATRLLSADDVESRYLGILGIVFISIMAISAKRSHARTRDALALRRHNDELVTELRHKTKELEDSQALIDTEMDLALSIFDSINPVKVASPQNVTYHLSSHSAFNGDILLMATRPDGRQHFMLGDFTGHGLAASIGALPVADIFYSMTKKGFKISEIAFEMNRRLYTQLPANLFLAACLAEVDATRGRLRIWNGGLPSVYILHGHDGTIKQKLESDHPPLGILPPDNFDSSPRLAGILDQDQLFMATDGVVEQKNSSGKMFGEARLERLLNEIHDIRALTASISKELESFCAGTNQGDDITFVAIRAENAQQSASTLPRPTAKDQKLEPLWTIDITLETGSLKKISPAPLVNHLVQELCGNQQDLSEFQLVLTELYNNALDHGVLGLKSEMKDVPDNPLDYYELREERLNSAETGMINIEISCKGCQHGSILELHITDSGDGFEYSHFTGAMPQNTQTHGRGLALVKRLCNELEYEGSGNRVRALYHSGMTESTP
jgi:serine phosphatase RsbU (regulator of sigma subunit)/anti-sigma regulatory factor (Ser/Thr protein kinase)